MSITLAKSDVKVSAHRPGVDPDGNLTDRPSGRLQPRRGHGQDRHGEDDVEHNADALIELAEEHSAHNYHPLPVVIASAAGAWVTDVAGHRYLDCLAGYSALNFGHGHPEILAAAHEQLDRVTLVSRAFHHDQFGPFCAELAALAGKDMVVPMNSGAEAVETAIKVARKWGYTVKGIPAHQATIIVAEGNFHGRTTTIVSFSDDDSARDHFGPYTPGFVQVEYGNIEAIRAAITDHTAAVLIEPIQGEGGVVIPPEGYLRDVRALTAEHNVLMLADEIQSGLARTGRTFACDHEGVVPDIYILGKALGGGRPAGLGHRRGPRRPRRAPARRARQHVRRQPAGVRGRARGRPAAADRRVPGARRGARRRPRRRAGQAGRATGWSRSAPAGRGPGWTSTPTWPPAARSARRCWPAASWPRTPTARRSAWHHRW